MSTNAGENESTVVDQQLEQIEPEINKVEQLLKVVSMNNIPLTSAQSPSGYHFVDNNNIIEDEYSSLNEEDDRSSDIEHQNNRSKSNLSVLEESNASEVLEDPEDEEYDELTLTILSLEHRNKQLLEQVSSMEKDKERANVLFYFIQLY